MTSHGRRPGLCAALAFGLVLALGGGTSAGSTGDGPTAQAAKKRAKPATVTLRHAASKFRVRAPRGFKLRVRKGVYVLSKGRQTMSFSRALTGSTPDQFGAELLEQLGGQVVLRRGGQRFLAQVDRGSERETLVISRAGEHLAVTTSTSPRSRPTKLAVVRRVGSSARGGFVLKPPVVETAPVEIPLKLYTAPDGGSTAMVPDEPGWTFDGGGGTVQGSSPKGVFLFGLSFNVIMPEIASGATLPPSVQVSPYMSAPDALTQMLPRLDRTVSDVRITKVLRESPLASFTSSGFYQFDYLVNGQPWTGMALMATDSPEKLSNYAWNMYYSGIGVPAGSDGSTGAALLKTWGSWNPSGAIAQRAAAAKQLIDETNQLWKETNEFRSRAAQRQSRDVGCLLAGYYSFEDNSRKYDLPPLPCDQQYVPGS